MTYFDTPNTPSHLSQKQRWSHYLAVIFALGSFFIGVNLRDSTLNATTIYTNTGVGIRGEYPQNWLIDTEGDYVFRVRNISESGFPTTIQVAVQSVSQNTSVRYIFDALTLNRSQTLASYNVLSSGIPFILSDETTAMLTNYTFATSGKDPFLENIAVVVRGQDVVSIRRGQAIIISFLSISPNFNRNYPIFERFINSLEF